MVSRSSFLISRLRIYEIQFKKNYGGLRTTSNRLTLTPPVLDTPSASETYAYNASANQLATLTDASGTRSISYDNRGNTCSG